ncbi:MAG: F0F1 ATP synthase subunit gamma, partial [Thermoguttaceae bacterium]|nr:F0F1 ATP synthase subunit gamma [Thermoguttaceae bacterium]
MAKARALDRRRKSIQSTRKITHTMELISTATYRKAMDRAVSATAYTNRLTAMVGQLARAGLEVQHPLLQKHENTENVVILTLTSNRG